MLSKLLSRFRGNQFTSEYVIEKKFSVGGRDYYGFADINNLPYKRGLMAVAIYNELDMRCSREYLIEHTDAIDRILRGTEINIFEVNKLNEQMKQRLMLNTDVDLMYKVAAVAYFDKNENPEGYDQAYCDKKIAHWKKHKGVADFFLSQPLMELIPYLQNVDVDLETYSQLTKDLNEVHLAVIRSLPSNKA